MTLSKALGFPKQGKKPKRSRHKFGAKRQEVAGRSFGSKLELAVFEILKLRELAGEIKDIQQQVHVKLSAAQITYIPDFRCTEVATGKPLYVEAKGFQTPEWRIKRRLWIAYADAPLEIWMGSHNRPTLKEILIPEANSTLAAFGQVIP